MTYARFLALFVLLPILASAWLMRRELPTWRRLPLGLLLFIVYATTSPWDNVAVRDGLWQFDEARIWGVRIGYLPLEEYLFFGLQTVLTALWVMRRLHALETRPGRAR